jgi:hypothetical protein
MASAAVASNSSSTSSATLAINNASRTRNSSNKGDSDATGMNGQHEKMEAALTADDSGEPSHGNLNPFGDQKEETSLIHHSRMSSEATLDTTAGGDGPLPRKLKQILNEVARTGFCSWLSWDQENDPSATNTSATCMPQSDSKLPAQHHAASSYAAAAPAPASSSWENAKASARRPTQGPPRKMYRNGMHNKGGGTSTGSSRMRFGNLDGASSGRKRPLFSGRGGAVAAGPGSVYSPAPSSVGSGRTSGSEPDDSTMYECDSEGTSATTNSEVSVERHRRVPHQLAAAQLSGPPAHAKTTEYDLTSWEDGSPYKTLQAALRSALGLVLDHFYHTRGGYKLSPAEKRRKEALDGPSEIGKNGSNSEDHSNNMKLTPLSSEDIFLQRRQRLMMMLLPSTAHPEYRKSRSNLLHKSDDPPFTIQRLAEVLIAPERVRRHCLTCAAKCRSSIFLPL